MPLFDLQQTRAQYLERLLTRYGTITLPIDSTRQPLPLQTIFQPMVLHRDPLAPRTALAEAAPNTVKARDGADALSQSAHGRMVVLGGPGMGKTTALKALLSTAITTAQADPVAPLPLFISLPDLMRAELSFERYTQQIITELEIDPLFAHTLTKAVHNGSAFLCLDSLDEVLPALRPDVIAFLNQEALRCQGTWIIGSRFTEYKGGQFVPGQFTEWELQALDEQAGLTLAGQLLPAVYAALFTNVAQDQQPALPSPEAFITELYQRSQIVGWTENPLLFSLAAILYTQTASLPASRAILYAQVTDAMFALRVQDAGQRAQLRSVLAEMALEFYQTRGRNFSISDALEFLPSFISDQNPPTLYAFLARILDSGILEPVAYQVYGFKHQMFQEYLVAVALAQRCLDPAQRQSAWDLLWRKRRLSRWNEILRLLFGILVQEHGAEGLQIAHEWLSALAQEQSTPEGDPGNLCLILAMKSLDELGEHITEPAVASLAQHILKRWEQAKVASLRQEGGQYAQTLLVQARVLWAFNLQIVAPIILHLEQVYPYVYFDHPVPPGGIKYSFRMKILWYLLEDTSITLYACYTLRTLQTPAIIERLIALVENIAGNWSMDEQTVAMGLLSEMGEEVSLLALRKIWQDTTVNEDVRMHAARSFSETQAFVPDDVFVAMFADQNYAIRCIALQALSKRDGQVHTDLFLSALHDPYHHVREDALQIVYKLGVYPPIELLQTLFYGLSESISELAWKCLQALGDQVPLELWLGGLQHICPWVRNYALVAVERYRDQVPVEPLLAMLSLHIESYSKQMDVYAQCIQALGLLGDRVPLEPLFKLLTDSDEALRLRASQVLTLLGVTLPADLLLPQLNSSTSGNAAAQALAAIGPDAPISALLEMMQSHSFDSMDFAVEALCLLSKYVPTEPLLKLLQDEELSLFYPGLPGKLIALLQLQGVDLDLELFLPALKRLHHNDEAASIVAVLSQAGAQAPIEPLLRLAYEEAYGLEYPPMWIQPLLYGLYEWVLQENLTNALANTFGDQWLAVSLLGLVHDEESIQLLSSVAQDPTRDRKTRSEALKILNNLGINSPLEYLLQATRWSIDDEMGAYLAQTVERLGEQAPIAQLLPLLGEDHNRLQPGVVASLVRIAEHLQPETILPLLEDKNELVRCAALRVLGAMGERVPFAVFSSLLHSDEPTLDTRYAVCQVLATSGTPAAAELLFEALENEDPEIKRRALWALKGERGVTSKGWLKALTEQNKALSLAPLLSLLNDPDERLVRGSIDVLGELGRLGVVVPTEPLAALLSHEDVSIAKDAAEALCKSGEYALTEALLAKKYDLADETVQDAIFSALRTVEAYLLQEAKQSILADTPINVAALLIEYALAYLATWTPEQIIQQLHADSSPSVRQTVLQAIQNTQAYEWLPLVLATLDDADGQYAAHDYQVSSDERVRYAAIQALGSLNAQAPLEPLLQLLYTNEAERSYYSEYFVVLRIVVLEALRQFGSRVPLTALLPLLGSNHKGICRLAFEHLQEFYPAILEELVPALKAILRGEPVQGAFAARLDYRAAEMVAAMGRATPAVLEMVTDLLANPYWEVRERAVKTLGTLRRNIPDRAIRRLLDLRKDPESPDVRAAADQALAEILSLEQGMEDE